MSYTDFVKPYVDGWENGESGNTPITAEILNNNYDAFLIALNTWASGVPEDANYVHTDNNYTSTEKTKLGGIATGATATSFDRVVSSGTKLGTLTINGTSYDIYAPNAGAGSLSALSDVTLSSPSNGQVLKYDSTSNKWINANESGGGGGYEPTGEVYTFMASGSAAQANLELDVSWTDGSTTEMYVVGDYLNLIAGWGNRDYKNIRTNWDTSNQCWKLISKSGYFECGGSYAGEGEVIATIASGNKVLNAVTYTPGPSVVEWDQIQQTGTKIATITIDGVDTDVYAPTSGGASSFSGLSDVDVSNPSTGQVPIYNATSSKWENGSLSVGDTVSYTDLQQSGTKIGTITINGTGYDVYAPTSGGGTTVVANPSGSATEELEKLQVGNTIYSIPEGSGSGGSDIIDIQGTLTAGSTSITLQSNKIKTTSIIGIYTDIFGVSPTNATVINGSITLTFPAQQSDMGVLVSVRKVNLDIVFDLPLPSLETGKTWFAWDNMKGYVTCVDTEGDGIHIYGGEAANDWTTSGTLCFDLSEFSSDIPVTATAFKLHFSTFVLQDYAGIRIFLSNTKYEGGQEGRDTMLRQNGSYQIESSDSVDASGFIQIPISASTLSNYSYMYIMVMTGIVHSTLNNYSNANNGSFDVQIDGINFVTGGNS